MVSLILERVESLAIRYNKKKKKRLQKEAVKLHVIILPISNPKCDFLPQSPRISSQKLPFTNYTVSGVIHISLMRNDSRQWRATSGLISFSVGWDDLLTELPSRQKQWQRKPSAVFQSCPQCNEEQEATQGRWRKAFNHLFLTLTLWNYQRGGHCN